MARVTAVGIARRAIRNSPPSTNLVAAVLVVAFELAAAGEARCLPYVGAASCRIQSADDELVSAFTNGTDFAQHQCGPLDPNAADPDHKPGDSGVYWLPAAKSDSAVVTNIASVSSENYLTVGIDTPLERLVMPRLEDGGASNVLLQTAAYDGIYFDSHVRLMPSATAPDVESADKIVVWLREAKGERDEWVTNLVVTAGYYAGDFKNVVCTNYVIESPSVAAGSWHRLTISALSDVTGGGWKGTKNPGFVIHLDGTQAVARAGSSIGNGYDADFLTPLARVLIGERGLFPWLVRGGQDAAMTLSRFAFSGQMGVGDVLFTTARPDCVAPGNVFTLKWDAGVKSMRCIVSNAAEVVTNDDLVAECPSRHWDYRIGTNVNTVVTVTNVAYKTESGYSNGVWSVGSGCVLAGNAFVCDGTSDNPVGCVASSRDIVSVGGGGYETFAEAKLRAMEKARAKGESTAYVALETNWVIAAAAPSGGTFKDRSTFSITNGDDIVLDLNGHTLQGGSTSPTITHKGGKLRIEDSKGGGAVLCAAKSALALLSEAYAKEGVKAGHELVIRAGHYAGEVRLTGGGNGKAFCGTCVIDGGTYTNVCDAAGSFYLEQYVTNATAYYGLGSDDCWAKAANGFVWVGHGADKCWDNADNWRGKAVPTATDLAIFPRTNGAWAVDFGLGAAFKSMLMDGDVAMAGTNVFSDVTIAEVAAPFASGGGRLVGAGTAVFTNVPPGNLTGDYAGDGEVRLGADWTGTVRIGGVATATNLVWIGSWGLEGSKVEFNGVRGYLSNRKGLTLPYELVLTDDGATNAWKNETGYTGSTIVFPRLSGSGTFESPANLRAVLQIFRFEDVADFTGRFLMGGKRLVLGAATAKGLVAGSVTFADGARVRTGEDLGWKAVTAYFGKTLYVTGETNDVLMAYTGTTPDVREVTVYRTGADGEEVTNWLAAADGKVVVTGEKPAASAKMMLGAKAVYATDAGAAAKSGTTLGILPGSAVSIVGNDIVVNGWVVSSVAGYYSVSEDEGLYSVSFKESEVKPQVADFAVSEGAGGIAEIVVRNAQEGLWYGVETRTTLAVEGWAEPVEWVQAEEDGELYLSVPKTGDAGSFYRVIVTDREP